jgi:hypothetical protein
MRKELLSLQRTKNLPTRPPSTATNGHRAPIAALVLGLKRPTMDEDVSGSTGFLLFLYKVLMTAILKFELKAFGGFSPQVLSCDIEW